MRRLRDSRRSATWQTTFLVVFGSIALVLGACGGSDDAEPQAVIEAYIEAYNAADVDGIVELFAADAVIHDHPGGSYSGTAEIRALHEDEADGTVAYTISNVTVEGNTVTWDHVWVGEEDGEVFEFCVEGHVAEVENGKIVSWQWPVTDFQC